jgi:pyruvate kinase
VLELKKLFARAARQDEASSTHWTAEAIDNTQEIIAASMVMVARGDLGVKCRQKKCLCSQKRIINSANDIR